MTEDAWLKSIGVDHSHCPLGCEHPQPFVYKNKVICGRCWFVSNIVTEMIPCTPDICDRDYWITDRD